MLAFYRHDGPGPPVAFEDHAVAQPGGGIHTLLVGRDMRTGPGARGTMHVRTRVLHWLVCKRHVYITRDRHHRFFAYDVSRGGTFVNDVRIPLRSPHELASGDVITLGAGRFLLRNGHVQPNPHALVFTPVVAPRLSLARGRRRPNDAASLQRNREAVMRAVSCPVCTEPFCNAMTMSCGHTLCQSCAATWLASLTSCPTCRAPATMDDLRPVIGMDDVADVAIGALGTREDIASLAVRRAHQRLPGDCGPPVVAQEAPAGPVMLTPETADEETVLMRARIDGSMQYFIAFRRALDSL